MSTLTFGRILPDAETTARNTPHPVGSLISVPDNEHGHVDKDHLKALVNRLAPLADVQRRGDVL
ncbi:MAG: hypothetical protein ACE5HX_15095, partial [bacterium]